MKKIVASFVCLLWLTACSSNDSGIKITKAEYGAQWPFTVEEGYLDCIDKEVVFRNGRKIYSLSGEDPSTNKHIDVNVIWREDPKMKGTKILLSPLVEKGRKICH